MPCWQRPLVVRLLIHSFISEPVISSVALDFCSFFSSVWLQNQPRGEGIPDDLWSFGIQSVPGGIVEGLNDSHSPRFGNGGEGPRNGQFLFDHGRLLFAAPADQTVAHCDRVLLALALAL